jgi:hypothetical protein
MFEDNAIVVVANMYHFIPAAELLCSFKPEIILYKLAAKNSFELTRDYEGASNCDA